ncbi:MAG: hypothetical protein ACO3F2_04600 [Roseiflexaceae bacterium]
MKQGMLLILLIAIISMAGYTLYRSNHARIPQLWDINETHATSQPTPFATPTVALDALPTVVIVVPTAQSGPTQLPSAGALDSGDAWSNTLAVALLIGLLITSMTIFWLGRRS